MKLHAVIFLLLLCYLLFLVVAYILKIKILVVTSNSMKPTFEFGDVLLAVSQEHYQLDDIISFTAQDTTVTHRILSVKNSLKVTEVDGDSLEQSKEYQTKGDANISADLNLIPHERILGKVKIIIPKIGYLVLFLQAKFTAIAFILISLFVLTIQPFIRKLKYAK